MAMQSDPFSSRSRVSVAAQILLFFVRAYRYLLSPHFGTQCRFTPTCSCYAHDALTKYGAIKGSYMTSRRLLKCHPWHEGGYDPVP
ncbi:MAG: membrane protein insertion efficiency factor YidD [Usitatibacteraceae bacterium]